MSSTVNVLMAVYNTERYLRQAVDSILGQTFTDFELIVINDGSTDGSEAILREYASRDPRVKLTSRENRGLGQTRVELLAQATAEFIAIMDSDDVSLPRRLEKQVAYLRQHPRCVGVGSAVLMTDCDLDPLNEWILETAHAKIEHELMRQGGLPTLIHPAMMLRRDAVVAVGGYNPRWQTCEDRDLFLRLAEHGELANLPEVLLKYRQHLASTCHAKVEQLIADSQGVLAEAYARRGLAPLAPEEAGPEESHRRVDYYRRWGWWALQGGHVRTARKYAWAALRCQPLAEPSWRLLYCALRGH